MLCAQIAVAQSPTQSKPVLERDPVATPWQREGATNGASDTKANENQPPNYSTALERIESAIRDPVSKDDEREGKGKEDREISDLQAQWAMARWAEAMFWATLASVITSCFGLLLIWRTLHHTRRAADYARAMVREAEATTKAALATAIESEKASAAAARQADTAQQALRGLERPYLFFAVEPRFHAKVTVTQGGPEETLLTSRPFVMFHFTNHGRMPAVLRTLSVDFEPLSQLPREIRHIPNILIDFGTVVDRGQSTQSFVPPVGIELSQDAMVNIAEGKSFIWLRGLLTYAHPTGDEFETEFLWMYNGLTQMFTASGSEHNRMT